MLDLKLKIEDRSGGSSKHLLPILYGIVVQIYSIDDILRNLDYRKDSISSVPLHRIGR